IPRRGNVEGAEARLLRGEFQLHTRARGSQRTGLEPAYEAQCPAERRNQRQRLVERLVLTPRVIEPAVDREGAARLQVRGDLSTGQGRSRLLVLVDAKCPHECAGRSEVDEVADTAVEAVDLRANPGTLEDQARVRLDSGLGRQRPPPDLVSRLREVRPVRVELEERGRTPGPSHVEAQLAPLLKVVHRAGGPGQLPEIPRLRREREPRVGVRLHFANIASSAGQKAEPSE